LALDQINQLRPIWGVTPHTGRKVYGTVYSARDIQHKGKVVRLERFWALWKEQNEAFPTIPPSSRANGQVEGAQTPCQGRKCAKMGTTQSGKHLGIWGGSERWGRKASDGM
jgi:hypothetical protein